MVFLRAVISFATAALLLIQVLASHHQAHQFQPIPGHGKQALRADSLECYFQGSGGSSRISGWQHYFRDLEVNDGDEDPHISGSGSPDLFIRRLLDEPHHAAPDAVKNEIASSLRIHPSLRYLRLSRPRGPPA
jgi:hypothetical protein